MLWAPEFLVKSSALLSLAAIFCWLLRRASADIRHRIWLAAIFGSASAATFLLFPRTLPSTMTITVSSSLVPSVLKPAPSVSALFEQVWLAGVAICLLRLITGIGAVAWMTWFGQDKVRMPLTWGVGKPVVLLPPDADSWPELRRSLAVAHEEAHIKRIDWLAQIVASIIASIFWFQPLLWIALAQLRKEAERAADDAVLLAGAVPADYATELVEVARAASGLAPMAAIPMARANDLEDRVRRILNARIDRRPVSGLRKTALVSIAVGLCWTCGAAVPRGSIVLPSLLRKVEPQYSAEARAGKVQGRVRLAVTIGEDGSPTAIRVSDSLGAGLDEKAVEAVKQWRFRPATRNGRPTTVTATVEVNFRLL